MILFRFMQDNCVKFVRIQESVFADVPYNFLIGADGLIFEGRGFNRIAINTTTTRGGKSITQ